MTQPSPTLPPPRARLAADIGTALVAVSLAALALALRPTALTLTRSYASDSGVFYAVFHQLAHGARLYADVFDHKDPLFYAFYTLCYALIGDAGPMVWETALTLAALALAVLVARQAGIGLFGQAIVGLGFFAFFLHPAAYFPVHSNHQALTLALAALALGLARRDWLAGAVMGALVLTKLTHALYLPALALCILAMDGRPLGAALARVGRMAAGALAVVAAGALALLATGSLPGYLDVLRVNLRYQAEYASIRRLYWPSTPSSPLQVLQKEMSPALIGVHLALLGTGALHALWPGRLAPGGRARALLLTAAGLAAVAATARAILASSYAWPHYYEVLCLPALLAAVCGLALNERWLCRGWLGPLALALYLGAAGWSGAITPEPSYQGWREGQEDANSYERYLQPCIAAQVRAAGAVSYATLGGNRAVQVPRIAPAGSRLACRAFYQFPWFRGTILDELVSCIGEQRPDLVFQRAPDFPLDIEARLARLLREDYRFEASCGDVSVLRRR